MGREDNKDRNWVSTLSMPEAACVNKPGGLLTTKYEGSSSKIVMESINLGLPKLTKSNCEVLRRQYDGRIKKRGVPATKTRYDYSNIFYEPLVQSTFVVNHSDGSRGFSIFYTI